MEVKPSKPWGPSATTLLQFFFKPILKHPSANKSRGTDKHLCGEEGRFLCVTTEGPNSLGRVRVQGSRKLGFHQLFSVLSRSAVWPLAGHFILTCDMDV